MYRPSNGVVTILLSTSGYTTTVTVNSGVSNAAPTPADFDGDGRTDVVLFRASAGSWHVLPSGENFTNPVVISAGSDATVPLPADYDGDGKADLVVVQSGVWRILRSDSNYRDAIVLPGAPIERTFCSRCIRNTGRRVGGPERHALRGPHYLPHRRHAGAARSRRGNTTSAQAIATRITNARTARSIGSAAPVRIGFGLR